MTGEKMSQSVIELAYHNAEDTLLHLTGVLGTKDNHLHTLEVDLNRGRAGHTGRETIGRELAGVVDDEIGLAPVGEFLLGRADKHVVLQSNQYSKF